MCLLINDCCELIIDCLWNRNRWSEFPILQWSRTAGAFTAHRGSLYQLIHISQISLGLTCGNPPAGMGNALHIRQRSNYTVCSEVPDMKVKPSGSKRLQTFPKLEQTITHKLPPNQVDFKLRFWLTMHVQLSSLRQAWVRERKSGFVFIVSSAKWVRQRHHVWYENANVTLMYHNQRREWCHCNVMRERLVLQACVA